MGSFLKFLFNFKLAHCVNLCVLAGGEQVEEY